MTLVNRPLHIQDKAAWLELWTGYTHFYQTAIADRVTEHTWQRLLNQHSPMSCRVATVENRVVGFAIFVLHEGSWVTTPVCYLEDLFVAESMRGQGIARALIQGLIDEGKEQGWSCLYWHTWQDNPARHLYDSFVAADNFVRYRMHL